MVNSAGIGLIGGGGGGGPHTLDASCHTDVSAVCEAQGQILYRGACSWVVLCPGTCGQVLTTAGACANPSWTTVSGGEWTDTGTTIHPTETGDEVVIGGTSPLSSAKLSIDGDADQHQLLVQGFSTQTNALIRAENSAAEGVFVINTAATAPTLRVTNRANSTSAQVAIFEGTKGAGSAAANDEAYATLRLKNSAGSQIEAVRATWLWHDHTSASEDAIFRMEAMRGGSLVRILNINADNSARRVHIGPNVGTSSTGNGVVYIGSNIAENSSGGSNVIIGSAAGSSLTSGSNNFFGGAIAGNSNTTGGNNVYLGTGAGRYNNGSNSFALGTSALGNTNVTAASNSVAIGQGAQQYNNASRSIGIGSSALRGDLAGVAVSDSIGIGHQAGIALTTSIGRNIFLGSFAADSATSATISIAVGYDVELPSNTASGQMTIANAIFGTGNTGTGTTVSTGAIGIYEPSPDRALHVLEASALTNTVAYPLRLAHETSGSPAAGIGAGIEFEVETTAGNEVLATIEAIATDVSSGSECGAIAFLTMKNGAAANEVMRLGGNDNVLIGTTTDIECGHVVVNNVADQIALVLQGHSTQTTSLLHLENACSGTLTALDGAGGAVFNEQGNNADFRIESQNRSHMLFVDASADALLVGGTTSAPLHDERFLLTTVTCAGDHVNYGIYQARGTTSNNCYTVIDCWLIPSGYIYLFHSRVVGHRTDGGGDCGIGATVGGTWTYDGTTLDPGGSGGSAFDQVFRDCVNYDVEIEKVAGCPCPCTGLVQLRVRGNTGHTMTWHATTEINRVGS